LPKIAQTAGMVVSNPTAARGSTYGLLPLGRESVGEEECDSSAKHCAGRYDECEFRPAKLDFLHDSAKIVDFTPESNKECWGKPLADESILFCANSLPEEGLISEPFRRHFLVIDDTGLAVFGVRA